MSVAHQVVPDIRHAALLEDKCPARMCPAGHHVTATIMVAINMALQELRTALMKVTALQPRHAIQENKTVSQHVLSRVLQTCMACMPPLAYRACHPWPRLIMASGDYQAILPGARAVALPS